MEEQRSFGSYLRAERELRQIPLSEVSAVTKIPLQSLEKLESGEWSSLPAEVFLRGFVRSYARYVGIPAGDVHAKLDSTLRRSRKGGAPIEEIPVNQGEVVADVRGRSRFGMALFVIIVLIIATITLSLLWRRGAGARPQADLDSALSGSPVTCRHT